MHSRAFRPASLGLASIAAALAVIAAPGAASAHVVCGNRVFPATLTMDDPGVGDELSLPTVAYTPIPAGGGNPSGTGVTYGYEWDKTITQDLVFAINGDYITQYGAGQHLSGWDNITLTLKDQLPCLEANEFVVSFGVAREIAGTGSSHLAKLDAIDTVGVTTPTFYGGKGLGDLPIGFLRPLAITWEVGYGVSDWPRNTPSEWDYAFSVQYSLPYLQQHMKALDLPDFFTHLVPLVEIALSSPNVGPTTGTVAPGILYEGEFWQAGVEAIIPINAATRQSQGTGFIAQFHLFFDDIFPTTLGRPLVDTNLWKQ